MNTLARLALAAPLALAVTACGETTSVEDSMAADAELEVPEDVVLPTVEVEYPEVPADARTTLEYAGVYELRHANQQVSSITLRDDDSYTWRMPDGTETDGSFTWSDDGSRILIERDDDTLAYAVAENVLYALPSEDAPVAGERSEETTWRRAAAAPGAAASTAGDPAVPPAE